MTLPGMPPLDELSVTLAHYLAVSGVVFSIGIAIYPTDGEDFNDLLKDGLSAMQFAKSSGGAQY